MTLNSLLIPRPSVSARRLLQLFVALLLSALAAPHTHAQAHPTASKNMDISAFGGIINDNPDYGPQRNTGIAFGASVTRYFGWRVAPSLEARYTRTTGTYINERALMGGLRIQTDFHRFHPYADFLGGVATIHFDVPPSPGYTDDHAPVYAYGGGVDIDIVRRFQLKVDYQAETMSFDRNFSIAPRPLTIGVVYRIPFRPHVK